MELHVGTSGYSCKEWKGAFYPEDLAAGDMLRWYGERLNAVELDNTFYTDEDLERWAERLRGTSRERAFVFFRHEDEGAGPCRAARFRLAFLAQG